jgi:hypothetical protein
MPRFVILDHDHPFRHWDFLLEDGDKLRAWRLVAEPSRGVPIAAEPLPDHRPMYLDYQGPVGGGRGRVVRWDGGRFEWKNKSDVELVVAMAGSRLIGQVSLSRAEERWTWSWS